MFIVPPIPFAVSSLSLESAGTELCCLVSFVIKQSILQVIRISESSIKAKKSNSDDMLGKTRSVSLCDE